MPLNRLAGEALNILPDRMNLFMRYIGGVGNEGLKLDQSTLDSIRSATEKSGKLGAVNPYKVGAGPDVTQTLGRFTAEARPGGAIRIRDQYDMVNEAEDPDLVSGKIQPDKALLQIQGITDPLARTKLRNRVALEQGREDLLQMRPPMDRRGYGEKLTAAGQSPTDSPLASVARAAMYVLPIKPRPYDIDVTIPPSR